MGKILIKRGLQENVNSLVLDQGELAAALDTGNLYLGLADGEKKHINAPTEKLETAREFSITGDGTAQSASFDGSGDVVLNFVLNQIDGLTAGTYTKLTVNEKGQVVSGDTITIEDLPTIPASKIETGTTAGKVVIVGADGKIDESLIPAVAITDTFEAESEETMLGLSAQRGDICIRSDESKSYILTSEPASDLANWKWLKTPDSAVLSVNGKTGVVTLSYADVDAEQTLTKAEEKSSIVDEDKVIIQDSADSDKTKKFSFKNLVATLKTYFDGIYNNYIHPTHTEQASGLYKVTVDGEGHVSATEVVGKDDITALGIPAQDTTYTFGEGLSQEGNTVKVSDIDGGTF